MRRRRPIPPFRRQLLNRSGTGTTLVNPKLIEANRLFENGDYNAAAEIYEDLAEKALARQIPQSPHLFLLAGTARMKADENQNALASFMRGLGLLIERKKWFHLKRASENTIEKLRNNGFKDQAVDLKTWLDEQIPAEVKSLPIWIAAGHDIENKNKLPIHCPTCGAPINLKELDWVGQNTNCNYCGSLLSDG
jgi:DNA-directed RNA polymerase subunit RPC12/RpoP